MARPKLGDMLLEANLIDEVQMEIALQEQKVRGTRFGSTLLALHFIDENVLTAFLSRQLDIPCVSLANIEIPRRLLDSVPKEMALAYHVLPVREAGGKLHLAMCDPMDWEIIETVERHTGWSVAPMVSPQSSLIDCIQRHYSSEHAPARETTEEEGRGAFPDLVREVEEMDAFGRQFRAILDRLERIETSLARVESLLSGAANRAVDGPSETGK